jgi:hypothetical protein
MNTNSATFVAGATKVAVFCHFLSQSLCRFFIEISAGYCNIKAFDSLRVLASILPIRVCNDTNKIIKNIAAFVFFALCAAVMKNDDRQHWNCRNLILMIKTKIHIWYNLKLDAGGSLE